MDLVATYLGVLEPDIAGKVDRAAMAEALTTLLGAVEQAVPGIAAVSGEFVRSLAQRAGNAELPGLERAVELAIAFAAARGDAGALKALDELLLGSVGRAVARIDPSPAFADLVAQELRMHLLVGDRPRIAEYAGRGPIAGWLRTAASRIALNLRRGAAERGHDGLSSKMQAVASEPEVALLRARYRGDFEASLRAALAGLPSRERALLSLSVRDGLNSEKIAGLYGVSRATAKRMLVRARGLLLTETKRELRGRLELTSSEFHSVARAVCDDMDISVVRLLQSEA
jgi:RNA polymerase sigma-70 factor (ECF subfamily)